MSGSVGHAERTASTSTERDLDATACASAAHGKSRSGGAGKRRVSATRETAGPGWLPVIMIIMMIIRTRELELHLSPARACRDPQARSLETPGGRRAGGGRVMAGIVALSSVAHVRWRRMRMPIY